MSPRMTEARKEAPAPTITPVRTAPPAVRDVLKGPGRLLDREAGAYFEPRFGHDFSRVRVHADGRADQAARSVNALAYTVGNDIVFQRGRYSLGTEAGRRLLSHELAHVVQQADAPGSSGGLETGAPDDSFERQARETSRDLGLPGTAAPALARAPYRVQREVAPGAGTATTSPAFSVDQTAYLAMVRRAIATMSGGLVEGNTLAGVIRRIYEQLVTSVTWRDQSGTDTGGGAVSITLPGTPAVTLSLRLVLDDQADPRDGGRFEETGTTSGTIFARIRNNGSEDILGGTLYHEGLHLMEWVLRSWGAARVGASEPRAVRALAMTMYTTQIAGIRRVLRLLADSVNPRRRAAGRAEVTDANLDRMAPWLMEEVQVRAETEVFRLFLEAQRARATRGPSVVILSTESTAVDLSMVTKYVFEFSRAFSTEDQTGLTTEERALLTRLRDMLLGFFRLQVRRRFSWEAYAPRGIPRAPVEWTPPPLEPPSFLPRIEESVRRAPF